MLPEPQRPSEQTQHQDHRHQGMHQPQFFQITQATGARRQLSIDRGVELAMLAQKAAECLHHDDIANDVDHLAIDRGGLIGEIMVQRLARSGDAENRDNDGAGDDGQGQGHPNADRGEKGDRAQGRDAGRQYVPDERCSRW